MMNMTAEVYDEELVRGEMASYWKGLRDSVIGLEEDADQTRCSIERYYPREENTPEFENVQKMLMQVEDYVHGVIEALTPGAYGHYKEFHCGGLTRKEREAVRYAVQEGVNYVALKDLPLARHIEAIEYIAAHNLASRNYDATLKAVEAYKEEMGLLLWA